MLHFRPITIDSLEEIKNFLPKQTFRTCDFTVGGIYMWIDYFNYEYCIADNLLFIKGNAEDASDKISFSIPVGDNSLACGLSLLREYCTAHNYPLILSAVPEEGKNEIENLYPSCTAEPLSNWSDYLYAREDLATLTGHKFNRKRNRVNKFYHLYENITYRPMSVDDMESVKVFFDEFKGGIQKTNPYFDIEENMVDWVLANFGRLGLVGGMLLVNDRVVAFSIGEVVNDTLFVHIEKASREYIGSYEVINMLFVQNACTPEVRYVNREEDVGDEGVRMAKQSYNPIKLLHKFNVYI